MPLRRSELAPKAALDMTYLKQNLDNRAALGILLVSKKNFDSMETTWSAIGGMLRMR